MKKLSIILMVLFTTITFAQNNNNNNNNNNNKDNKESFFSIVQPYVETLANGISEGVDLVKEEAPIVIQQYLTFTAIEYWVYVSLGVLILIMGFIGFWYIGYLNNKGRAEEGVRWIPLVIGQVVGLAVVCSSLFTAIKVTWFPKLYLIERFIELL